MLPLILPILRIWLIPPQERILLVVRISRPLSFNRLYMRDVPFYLLDFVLKFFANFLYIFMEGF